MEVTINETFQVEEPVDKVWQFITDPYKMVVCMPGAQLTEKIDDKNFKGEVSLKIGPILTKYSGKAVIEEMDSITRKIKLTGKGLESKGQGSATMVLSGQIKELENGLTELQTSMKISITGKVAQLGSRMIKAVSKEMFNKFQANLVENVQKFEGEELVNVETKPIGAMSLVFKVTLIAIASPFVRFFKWITGKSQNSDDSESNS